MKKRDAKYFRMNGQTTHHHYLRQILDLPKETWLNYIASSMSKHPEILPRSMTFILGGMMEDGSQTILLRNGVSEGVGELSCKNYEKADTRIFAHLAYCLQNFGQTRAIIDATDTDIVMLSCYHLLSLEGLQKIWIQMNDKYMPIHDLLSLLSINYDADPKEMSGTFVATYVLSGYDTVSYPYRRGKKKAALTALRMTDRFPAILAFGDQGCSWKMSSTII